MMTLKLHAGGWACFLKESLEREGNAKKSASALAKRLSIPWKVSCHLSWKLIFFQEEDVIQDRFVVHLKPYRDIREFLTKRVISGNIEDIAAALTVRISTIIGI